MFLRQPTPKEATKREVEKALEILGFTLRSHHGSHYRSVNTEGIRIDYRLINGRKVEVAAVKDIAREIQRQELDQ